MGSLEIAVAQPEAVPHDVAHNAALHAEAIRAARARVVVFPEMSLTGYELDAREVDPSDSRLSSISDACGETGSIAFASGPIDAGDDRVSIGVLIFDGGEPRVVYRKIWLGQLEETRYLPGVEPAVIEVDGWRLGLVVCKDTGEADHAAETSVLGMDIYVAGVLEHAHERHIHPARAKRVAAAHGVWVVISSFAGSAGEGYEQAAGGSGIWRPDGTLAAQAGSRAGEIVTAVINR